MKFKLSDGVYLNIATEFVYYNLRSDLEFFTVVARRVERELFYNESIMQFFLIRDRASYLMITSQTRNHLCLVSIRS